MLERDWVWSLIGIGATLWAIGGAGPKWMRRFLWPSVLVVVSYSFVFPSIHLILGFVLTALVLSLAYHEETFILYGISLVPFGVGFIPSCCVWIGSRTLWDFTHRFNWFPHKWFEIGTGALQGGVVAWSLLQR